MCSVRGCDVCCVKMEVMCAVYSVRGGGAGVIGGHGGNLCKLVVIVGLVSLVLQCLTHSGLCFQGNLTLFQVCLCHFLLLCILLVLRRKGREGGGGRDGGMDGGGRGWREMEGGREGEG